MIEKAQNFRLIDLLKVTHQNVFLFFYYNACWHSYSNMHVANTRSILPTLNSFSMLSELYLWVALEIHRLCISTKKAMYGLSTCVRKFSGQTIYAVLINIF